MAHSLTRVRLASLALVGVIAAGAAAFGIYSVFDIVAYGHYKAAGVNMEPTIEQGSSFFTTGINQHHLKRGELVLYRPPANLDLSASKAVSRIVALPGDAVSEIGGRFAVNGVVERDSYVHQDGGSLQVPEITVPAGEVYVLGDNRLQSIGSNFFGPLPDSTIVGRISETNAPSFLGLILRSFGAVAVLGICTLVVRSIIRVRPPRTPTPPERFFE